jgi:DNA polymerase III alpha subunit (gram-positive type)
MPMFFCVHDTETTDLTRHRDVHHEKQPKIIEFAGILTDGEKIIDQIEFLCNPQEPLQPIITKITGLTDEILQDKPRFVNFIPQVRAYFMRGEVVISHNLSFDKALLKYEMDRVEGTLQDCAYPLHEICTVEQTFAMYGRRMKLSELYEKAVGPYVQKHRAMDDVMLLHEICQRYGIYEACTEAYS